MRTHTHAQTNSAASVKRQQVLSLVILSQQLGQSGCNPRADFTVLLQQLRRGTDTGSVCADDHVTSYGNIMTDMLLN